MHTQYTRKTMTDVPVPMPTAPNKPDLVLPIILVCMAVASGIVSWYILTLFHPVSTPVTLPNRQKTQSVETQMPQAAEKPTSSTPAITPTPNKGPGNYVCDTLGYCNISDEQGRRGCPVTFADPKCLSSCGDTAKRCP